MKLHPLAVSVVALAARAQLVHADPPSVDVDAAMQRAVAHHPIHDEDAFAVSAAQARVDVERAKYWPDLQVFAQLDRSTANAGAGALFGVANLPVVGGMPGRVFDSGRFVTAAGATAAWDALGFLRWDASIAEAQANVRLARVDASARLLDVAYLAADRLIAVVTRDQAITAARAGVDRAQVFVTLVKAAVDQNLRPAADLSRAEAELALAKTALIRAEAARDVGIAQLAEALGEPGQQVAVSPGGLLALPARPAALDRLSARDPRIVAAQARVDADKARKRAVEAQILPKLNFVAALWARAYGGDSTGIAARGLVPDVPNWALGVVLSWPVFIGKTVGPQARAEAANIARDEAREREVSQRVESQIAQARAVLDGAYRVAETTPIGLKAARDAEKQATARYQAKLSTADDVAQAQRLLEQAEIDDAVARLDVWRAILLASYATGDLAPFSAIYHQGGS